MDKFIFRKKRLSFANAFYVLDDHEIKRFYSKEGWLGDISIFEKKDTVPCFTIKLKTALTFFPKYIVREKTGMIIGEIIRKFIFRFPNCFGILNVQSRDVMFSIRQRRSFHLKTGIFLNEEPVGMFCENFQWLMEEYTMDLAHDPGQRIDRRLALAAAAFFCHYGINNEGGS